MEQNFKDEILSKAKGLVDRLGTDANALVTKDLIEELAQVLIGATPLRDGLVQKLRAHNGYEVQNFMNMLFRKHWGFWGEYTWPLDSPVIRAIIQRKYLSGTPDVFSSTIVLFIQQTLLMDESTDRQQSVDFLHRQGFTDKDIVSIYMDSGDDVFFRDTPRSTDENGYAFDRPLTAFGEYVLPFVKPSSGFLGFGKSSEIKDQIELAVRSRGNASVRTSWLALLIQYYPESLPKDISEYLWWINYGSKPQVNVQCALYLVKKDAKRFDSAVAEALSKYQIEEGDRFAIYRALNDALPGKYDTELKTIGERYLDYYKVSVERGAYYYQPNVLNRTLDEAYFDYLFKVDAKIARERIDRFFDESNFLNYKFFDYIIERYPEHALQLLTTALKKDPEQIPRYVVNQYYEALFEKLSQLGAQAAKKDVVQFAVERASKRIREMACAFVGNLGEVALTDGKELLLGKTVDERVTGALILSKISLAEARAALNDGVDKETNDDTRDIMLESLAEDRFKDPLTLLQVKEMIALAAKRKKLHKWSEKWISETDLPGLQWRDGGEALDTDSVRFLFYRMKRATGLNSDIEARQAIRHIDKSSSGEFAKALVKSFQDSNADTKIKYYLTLAALLGDNDMMFNLNALFSKSMTDKRMKMAEYVVGALAMVGTDKALRLVEGIYRKYASKKPAVSQAARAALDAAAQELSITMDELSDRIIPNFDFDGIYKTVTVDGEEFRAFVNDDFKISYLSDENKVRKSLPSNASKELKLEFKEIEKEIAAVTKLQGIRLEKYMVEERRWSSDAWIKFFFHNPIMSVYAMKLIWAAFDKNGQYINAFYCAQDATLYDIHDDEITLEPEQQVGILHPIYLTSGQREDWKQKLYDMSMITLFPIVDRSVVQVRQDEQELNVSQLFSGKDIPKGADFVNTYLVKRNWMKSTGDGGYSDFAKHYRDGLIIAHANIEGPAAWYQGGNTPAKMYDVHFSAKDSHERVKLKDLPSVFFSEVMADIEYMINAN